MTALRITPLLALGGQRWLRMIERNLLVYKHSIKYMYKDGEENAEGGSNGQ